MKLLLIILFFTASSLAAQQRPRSDTTFYLTGNAIVKDSLGKREIWWKIYDKAEVERVRKKQPNLKMLTKSELINK